MKFMQVFFIPTIFDNLNIQINKTHTLGKSDLIYQIQVKDKR